MPDPELLKSKAQVQNAEPSTLAEKDVCLV